MVILLVEDNETIIKGLDYAFHNQGYQVRAVTSYREARRFLSAKRADLVVLDIALPDGNGLELYQRIIKMAIAVNSHNYGRRIIAHQIFDKLRTKLGYITAINRHGKQQCIRFRHF